MRSAIRWRGTLAAGATLVLEPRFSASRFWQVAHASGATEVNTIAAVMNILIRRPRSEFVPGHRLRKLYGGPFSEEAYRVFHEEFGVPALIEGYGMSEVPGVLNNPFDGPHRIGSMGKPSRHPDHAMAFAEMKVVDDAGNDVPDGEPGELVVRTPIVMQGYYRQPEQTAAAFRDGWFLTGDLGRRDEDGYFWFVARKKDIIRRRGENISGAELDRVVDEPPGRARKRPRFPCRPSSARTTSWSSWCASPARRVAAADIADWCRARLAAIKVPRYVLFADALPQDADASRREVQAARGRDAAPARGGPAGKADVIPRSAATQRRTPGSPRSRGCATSLGPRVRGDAGVSARRPAASRSSAARTPPDRRAAALGQQRLVEQQAGPVGEARVVVAQAPHERMLRIDLEHRLRLRRVLARGLEQPLRGAGSSRRGPPRGTPASR